MIKYIELKTGFNDDGPAWIAEVEYSGSRKTLYFNDKAFKRWQGAGWGGNYFDVETRETYWISNPKKNEQDRHWAGKGKILIQADIVHRYLRLIDSKELSDRFEITTDIRVTDKSRFHQLENEHLKNGIRTVKTIKTKKSI